jgi:dTDP-6-deoxy-L-talose 4-dehydrogenase (NAD+)
MSRTQKVLITGANGYIGKHVVDSLLDAGVDVFAIDLSTSNMNPKVHAVACDIFDTRSEIHTLIPEVDACIHLAWKDGFYHNSNAHMEYLSSHYKFIHSLATGGVKKIAVMGSMHEIGYYEGCANENTPCNPLNLYGIAKDAIRRSTLLIGEKCNVSVLWLRAFYIYGDDRNNHSIFTKIIETHEEGKKLFPFTSGKQRYDFIHIDNLSEMITASILQEKITGIINCCSGKPRPLADMVEEFIKENNYDIQLDYGAYPERPYDSPAIWGDNTKIQNILQSRNK